MGSIVLFLNNEKKKNKEHNREKTIVKIEKEYPLVLYYEKQNISKENIFRYALQLEGNSAKLTLDEIKEGRLYSATIDDIDKDIITKLKKQIESSNFMEISQRHTSLINENAEDITFIMIVLNDEIKEVSIRNEAPKGAFAEVETLVKDFSLNTLGIPFALTSEETKRIGIEAFYKAEELFRNYEAKPLNLYLAIKKYKRAENMLSQFPYEKEELIKARLQKKEATALASKIYKRYQLAVQQASQTGNKLAERRPLVKIMEMVKPYGKMYMWAKERILEIDRKLNKRRK